MKSVQSKTFSKYCLLKLVILFKPDFIRKMTQTRSSHKCKNPIYNANQNMFRGLSVPPCTNKSRYKLAFAFSKSTMKTPAQCVKTVQS